MVVQGASWRPAFFPALFAVVRHPLHGVTLFDTGYSVRFMQATKRLPQRAYRWVTPMRLTVGDSAAEQLAHEGIAPESVERIVLSHFHADHIGGARDFPNARFVASREAWDAVRECGPFRAIARGFLPQLLPGDFESRVTLLDQSDYKGVGIGNFPSSYDLFGDGSVCLIPLPGHARGQLGLLAQTPGRRRFLIADAAWTTASFQQRRPHHRLAALILDDDRATRRTLDSLHALWKADPTLDIIPSHCACRWRELSQEPQSRSQYPG
jgi:glyoxylase-like metal-dependent hydrolase (beta-lactamase superfamily II)